MSKARQLYRIELWVFTLCLMLFIVAGSLTFFSYKASTSVGIFSVLLYVLARCVILLLRGLKYEVKSRLLLLFLLLLGLGLQVSGVKVSLFALMALVALDFLLLFHRYRKLS